MISPMPGAGPAFDLLPGQRRPRRVGRGGLAQLLVRGVGLPDRATGVEDVLGTPGKVFGRPVTAALDVADVRRVEAHLTRQRPLRQPPLGTPTSKLRREVLDGALER